MTRRRLALFAALLSAVIFLSACTAPTAPTPDSSEPVAPPTPPTPPAETVFTLAYSRSDSLNPFLMTTQVNRQLGELLYEGLTTLDASLHAQQALAADVRVSETTVTATLRDDAVFSDGSAVTAADVLASFEAAKACDTYTALLDGVSEAEVSEDAPKTVVFTLKAPDPYAAACLIFPVVRVKEDGTVLGSGRYVFDATPRLTANPQRETGATTEIRLLDLVDDESIAKGLELGNISYFYTHLADGTIPRVTSATTTVPTNSLVFLGANASRETMAKAEVRRAVSQALDRTALAAQAFAGYAQPALTTLPPAFVANESVTTLAATSQVDAAKTALAAVGYTVPGVEPPETGKEKRLSLTLLVNSDNGFKSALATQIKDQLEAVGVTVTVVDLPFKDYTVALRRGRYDLYIGELRLCANMDLSPLLKKGGTAFYGTSTRNGAVSAYAAFREGETTLTTFSAVFSEELPYIPVCWRHGMAAYDRSLTNVFPAAFSVYAGLENWTSGN